MVGSCLSLWEDSSALLFDMAGLNWHDWVERGDKIWGVSVAKGWEMNMVRG